MARQSPNSTTTVYTQFSIKSLSHSTSYISSIVSPTLLSLSSGVNIGDSHHRLFQLVEPHHWPHMWLKKRPRHRRYQGVVTITRRDARCTMSKRLFEESRESQVPEGDQNGLLPIHDSLSPGDEHDPTPPSGPTKKPRNFIATVVCIVPLWEEVMLMLCIGL